MVLQLVPLNRGIATLTGRFIALADLVVLLFLLVEKLTLAVRFERAINLKLAASIFKMLDQLSQGHGFSLAAFIGASLYHSSLVMLVHDSTKRKPINTKCSARRARIVAMHLREV